MQETWIGKIPWRSEQLSTPVFQSGGFFGLYSPWGLKESGMTEQLSLHYEDELWEILGKSVSGRGIANAKVLSWKVAIKTRNMKKVREEERSNVLINWLSKKKNKSCDFQCLPISYTMIESKLPPWCWGMRPWNEVCTIGSHEPVPVASEPQANST